MAFIVDFSSASWIWVFQEQINVLNQTFYLNRFCPSNHLWCMRIAGIWARNVIVFTYFRFHPSTRVVCTGQRSFLKCPVFLKEAFSVTVFTGYVWKVGQTGKKSPFSNQNWYLWTGPKSSLRSCHLGRYPILFSRKSVAWRQPTYQHTCSQYFSLFVSYATNKDWLFSSFSRDLRLISSNRMMRNYMSITISTFMSAICSSISPLCLLAFLAASWRASSWLA